MDFPENNYSSTGCLKSVLLIVIGVFVCLGSIAFAVERKCHAEASYWLKVYPDAEVVELTYSYLLPFSIGDTQRVLFTPDPITDVRRWYKETNTRIAQETDETYNGGFSKMFSQIISVENGTQITQFHTCAKEIEIGR